MRNEPANTNELLHKIRKPYLLFIADVVNEAVAKTAFGVRQWVPSSCLGQFGLPGSNVDLGLPDMTPETAAAAGVKSMVIGVAPPGGKIPKLWEPVLFRAVEAGLDIVSGMHESLAEVEGLASAATRSGVALLDIRLPLNTLLPATGRRRTGNRLLTIGTDCAVGKKYTALALTNALRARGLSADFRATGQTGMLIAGAGLAIDAIVSDYASAAAESLSPDAAPDHWDVIEGQGSLLHPAFAGVTMALLHGSQPDVLVLCHDPIRTHLHSLPEYPIPDILTTGRRHLEAAQLTNPNARLIAVSLDTSKLHSPARDQLISETSERTNLPCFDPLRTPLDHIIDSILK